MLIKKRSALAISLAVAATTLAYADEHDQDTDVQGGDGGDRWYATPYIGGISPDWRRGLTDHDFLYGAAFGRELGPFLNLQLNLEATRLGRQEGRIPVGPGFAPGFGPPEGPDHVNMYYPALELQGLLNRNWLFSPYGMVGVGVLRNVFASPFVNQTHWAPEAGIGAYIHLFDTGTSGFALRPEIKARFDNPGRTNLIDYIASIGFEFSFGGAPVEHHAAAATYEQPPPEAYTPPPAPPPPPPPPPEQPAPGLSEAGGTVTLTGVNFLHDSSKLTASSHTTLDDMAQGLREHPNLRVEIQGHTDSTGSAAHNELLSQRRADSVREYLLTQGVQPGQVVAHGYGESQPIDTNETAQGRAHNRRVVAKVISNPNNVAVEGAGETHLATPATPR